MGRREGVVQINKDNFFIYAHSLRLPLAASSIDKLPTSLPPTENDKSGLVLKVYCNSKPALLFMKKGRLKIKKTVK